MRTHWPVVPLWSLTNEIRRAIEPAEFNGDFFHYSIPVVEETGTGRIESASDVGSAKLLLDGGEVLISKLNPRKGRVLITQRHNIPVVASPEFIALHPNSAILDRFLAYWLSSETTRLYLDAHVQSVTRSHQRVTPELIRHLKVAIPPLDEQRRIAYFLDTETAHIDRIVALRNFQVEKLSEALLCEARRVTGPEWKKVPLRRVVASVHTGTTPTDLLHTSEPGNVPWYTPAALGGNLDLNGAEKSIRQEDAHEVPRFSAESILIVGIGESLGKVADLDHEATGNQQLTAIKVSPNADRRFIAWRLFAAYEEIRAWAQYSRVRIINNDVLKSFTIPIPPIERQIEVRQQLDHRHTQLADFRGAATRFSQLAAERRKALITAAVTGQFDVTTAGQRVSPGDSEVRLGLSGVRAV